METPTLTIVIPIHNEEENLPELIGRLHAVLAAVIIPYEILFIDDGSTDRSLDVLREFHRQDPRIVVLVLARNFGHQAALAAGMDHARGDAILCMDGDLQHPPELIPEILAAWQKGHAVVHLVKSGGGDGPWLRRALTRWSYAILTAVSDGVIRPNASDFYLIDRRVADALRALPERSRYHRGLIHWFGYPTTEITFDVAPRAAGQSRYTLRRRIGLLLDGLTSFSRLPLRLATVCGLVASAAAFIYGAVVVWQRFTTDTLVSGWATVVVLILFLGGIQLIAVGIIGEYVGKLYVELKGRPLYIVRERIGGASP
jgi:dolichol-phosphate mannosyltransferase